MTIEPPSIEEKIVFLEILTKKLELENDRLWETVQRLIHRTEELRRAVPHVKFEEW